MDGTVLIADDDKTIRTVLTQALTRAGCKVHATSSLTTLLRWVGEGLGDLVITDVVMPDGNGLEMLPKIADDRPELPVIVISAQNTIMTAIQAAEAEAFDYLPKPFDLPDLMKRSARALASVTSKSSQTPQGRAVDSSDDLPLIGRSAPMQDIYRTIARVMNTDLPLLIIGESGTGKSLIARAIHDLSDRAGQPFIILSNDGNTEDTDLQDTAERACGGTLVLDDLPDFSLQMQSRIVRLLDNLPRPAARVISTSRIALKSALVEGNFREDLYYRLDGMTVPVPALHERVEDIPLLFEHFLTVGSDAGQGRNISPEAIDASRRHVWPGNVRQLEFVARSLSLAGQENAITAEEFNQTMGGPAPQKVVEIDKSAKLSEAVERHLIRYFDLLGEELPPPGLYQRILHEMESPLMTICLEATGGNQAKCAEILGINRNTLRKKLTELDIRVTRRRQLM